MKARLTKHDLIVISKAFNNYGDESRAVIAVDNKIRKELGLSVPVTDDMSLENFTKRIVFYAIDNEVSLSGKWLKLLVKRVKNIMNRDSLIPSERLAKALGGGKSNDLERLGVSDKSYDELKDGVNAYISGVFPESEKKNVKDTVLGIIVAIFNFIDGRFGNRVLKPKIRVVWRFLTYGTIAVLFFLYVMCPFFRWWDKVISLLNYVIWG